MARTDPHRLRTGLLAGAAAASLMAASGAALASLDGDRDKDKCQCEACEHCADGKADKMKDKKAKDESRKGDTREGAKKHKAEKGEKEKAKKKLRGSFEDRMSADDCRKAHHHDGDRRDGKERHERRGGHGDGDGHRKGHEADRAREVTLRARDDGRRMRLDIDGERMSVRVDGERVRGDRLRTKEGEAVVLDKDGRAMFRFKRAGSRVRVMGDNGGELARVKVADDDDDEGEGERRVVLGITMSEPDEMVLEHLGIEPGTAVKIDRVYEGLPAAKAGLKAKDIIIRIGDEKKITTDNLGKLLNSHDPGEQVEFEVIRRGQRRTSKVELGAYKKGVFGEEGSSREGWFWRGGREGADRPGEHERHGRAMDGLRAEVHELRKRAEAHGGKVELKREEIERIVKHLEGMRRGDGDERWARRFGGDRFRGRVEFDGDDRRRFLFVRPRENGEFELHMEPRRFMERDEERSEKHRRGHDDKRGHHGGGDDGHKSDHEKRKGYDKDKDRGKDKEGKKRDGEVLDRLDRLEDTMKRIEHLLEKVVDEKKKD